MNQNNTFTDILSTNLLFRTSQNESFDYDYVRSSGCGAFVTTNKQAIQQNNSHFI